MSSIRVDYDILNQKQTPAFYASSLATRPAFGFPGRIFIDTDTPSSGIYRDTGSAWVQVADPGAGTTGTLQQVTTNGSSTTVGLSTSGNGIGIGTTIPASNKLDIHSASGINATFNGTTTNNAALQLQNAGTGKWNIQNLYNAGANSFQVYDVLNSTARLTILNTGVTTFSGNINADGGLEMSGQVLSFNQSGTRSWQVQATGGNLRFQSGDGLGTFSFLSPLSGTSASFSSTLTVSSRLTLNGSGTSEIYTTDASGLYLTAATSGGMYLASESRFIFRKATSPFTEYMRIESTGNVGLGVVSPLQQLQLTGNILMANNQAIRFLNSASAQRIIMTFDTSDNLQIGGGINNIIFTTNSVEAMRITSTSLINTASRLNVNGATDNALFSLNSGGTLYTVGFSPNATANSTNTLTLTTAQTTWIYTGTGVATWTLPTPSGTNQMFWIKNAGTGVITLNAFAGTNIINNSATSVSSITIAVGATVLIQQDGNVKSYQLQ